MKIIAISAAVCAAFFMSPSVGLADDQRTSPLILVKETKSSFAPEDFPWDLPEGRTDDVEIPLGELVLMMPWMDVEKNGDDSVTITASELVLLNDSNVDIHAGATLTDVEMVVRRLDEAMAVSGYAKTVAIKGNTENGIRTTLEGLEFALTSRGHGLVIAAAENNASFESDETQAALRALNFSLDYSVNSSQISFVNSRSDDSIPRSIEDAAYDFGFSSGLAESSIVYGDGRIGATVASRDTAFNIDGPIPLKGEIGLIAYDLLMPIEASDAVQPLKFGFELSDVSLNDTIWDLADPKGIFPRSFKTAKLDTAFDVILKKSIFETAGKDRNRDDLLPVGMQLTALELDGLGLDVSANGDVEMEGELPKSVTAFMSVAGLSEFMANIVKAKFLPQSQAILAEGIALQFGTEKEDGSLIFDVKTEDGIVTINGNRVAPLPQ